MNDVVQGVKSLFGGGGDEARRAEQLARQSREDQRLAQARQLQSEQVQRAETEERLGSARRTPRGRRLLLASTGEAGVKSTLG